MKSATAITIGNFDGVHLGHARLVEAARECVGPAGRVVAIFFDPHPAIILRPGQEPLRLTSAAQRIDWLTQCGADVVEVIRPTREFLANTPEQFLHQMVKQFVPSFIVEGSDFRFGKGRAGSTQTLRELEKTHGYRTIIIDPVEASLADQSVVQAGSSVIRWLLAHGRVRDAQKLLGRPYELIATVERGDQRGRTIGMPTVNLADTGCMLPADGIYAGVAIVERTDLPISPNRQIAKFAFPAAISVGTKPTFGKHPRVCEAHLIGYDGPLDDYGWTIRVQFHDWLRDQLTYSSVDALIEQLQRDVAAVEKSTSQQLGRRLFASAIGKESSQRTQKAPST